MMNFKRFILEYNADKNQDSDNPDAGRIANANYRYKLLKQKAISKQHDTEMLSVAQTVARNK